MRTICHTITEFSEARVSWHLTFEHKFLEPFTKKFVRQLKAKASMAVFYNSNVVKAVLQLFSINYIKPSVTWKTLVIVLSYGSFLTAASQLTELLLHLRFKSLNFYMFRGVVLICFYATFIAFVCDDDDNDGSSMASENTKLEISCLKSAHDYGGDLM